MMPLITACSCVVFTIARFGSIYAEILYGKSLQDNDTVEIESRRYLIAAIFVIYSTFITCLCIAVIFNAQSAVT